MVADVTGAIPDPELMPDENARKSARGPLSTWHETGTAIQEIKVDRCSLARAPTRASKICARRRSAIKGKKVASGLYRWSARFAEDQAAGRDGGLDLIFRQAGFDWRDGEIIVCLDEPYILKPGEGAVDFKSKLRWRRVAEAALI